MKTTSTLLIITAGCLLSGMPGAAIALGQNAPANGAFNDHQNMLDQLGITQLRSGKSGSAQSGPGFDLATANPWKDSMPDALTMKDGTKVTTAAQWPARRAEIFEDFAREVYGRIPANVPKVTWEVTATQASRVGGVPTVTKTLVGHVDNSGDPDISVNIRAVFTVLANASGPVPIMFTFGGGGATPPPDVPSAEDVSNINAALRKILSQSDPAAQEVFSQHPSYTPFTAPPAAGGGNGAATGWLALAIAHGWGYGTIDPASIQADGPQLTQGIIGLTNKGQPRKPDDWGALRAWGWGVSRLIDYFEANPDAKVDPKKVGIDGVSRYGKAALVTEAFDERVAVALVGSSGEGGAKLHRHDFGEAVENLTASGEYHWMAGNFLKYGADAPIKKTAADLPVDSHELIALCAPRPVFISYGVESAGDPKWVDAPGSFMAGILAGRVYRLLGKQDFGITESYLTAPMPAVQHLVGGELAWRQHEGGHTDAPNVAPFFDWVGQYIKAPPATK
ncbi:MAG TPA: hypothetical protein VK737_08270 [Opitutales bacterium]|nr:hypothetical protein [Opitutales bacterium]